MPIDFFLRDFKFFLESFRRGWPRSSVTDFTLQPSFKKRFLALCFAIDGRLHLIDNCEKIAEQIPDSVFAPGPSLFAFSDADAAAFLAPA
jgi:hypothetical protein